MFLQYDEDKANLKDALKSAKAGYYAYRFFICFSYYIPLKVVCDDMCLLLYLISVFVFLPFADHC